VFPSDFKLDRNGEKPVLTGVCSTFRSSALRDKSQHEGAGACCNLASTLYVSDSRRSDPCVLESMAAIHSEPSKPRQYRFVNKYLQRPRPAGVTL
jgi:hypothetical protein